MQKDHLEILLEDIRGKFDLVLEGHEALNRKIDTKFDELNEKVEHNAFMIGTLNTKIDSVEERLNAKIDSVESNLSRHLNEVAADLSAHRADTEAHHGVYRVGESGE